MTEWTDGNALESVESVRAAKEEDKKYEGKGERARADSVTGDDRGAKDRVEWRERREVEETNIKGVSCTADQHISSGISHR